MIVQRAASRSAALILPVVLLVAAVAPQRARAEPRFAARLGFACVVCHVNPSGGGLRTSYARDVFEKQQLTFSPGNDAAAGLDFDPRISDRLTLGGDYRLAFIWQPRRKPDDPPPVNPTMLITLPTKLTFFPMQVDTYIGAELSRHVTLYTDVGANGSFEAFGLIHGLPLGTYFKAGYFIPPYGTKLPNHTAVHRQPFLFQPTDKDAGVEIGVARTWLDAQVSLQNGSPGSPFDQAYRPAISSRLALIGDLAGVKTTLGGSWRLNAFDVSTPDPTTGAPHVLTTNDMQAGGFLWLSRGRLTYIGEGDVRIKDDAATLNADNRATRSGYFVLYNELMLLAAQGVDVGLTYEFMDRDIYKSGDALHRFGVQWALFPAPYIEFQGFVRYYRTTFRPTATDTVRVEQNQWELIAFLHLFW
ncbi:MAG: hypothetical protein ACJ79R_18365 [Anaeromyxobacteraceae bacterium]